MSGRDSLTSAYGALEILRKILEQPLLPELRAHMEMQDFLKDRIPEIDLVSMAEGWESKASKLREQVLKEIIFSGVPKDWYLGNPEVVWSDVLETGKGYIIRKLRYEALPGFWIPALLYEPEKLEGKVPAVLNVNGHVGPPGKAIDYKQLRCINLAKRGMLALNPEWLRFGELQGEEYDHYGLAYLDICGVAGMSVFYLAMKRGLDVLLMHENADLERVAMTGLSGGGWQTIILSSLDTRIKVSVPTAGYIGLSSRVECRDDIGDLEQLPNDLIKIADYPVLTALLAPRPALLIYNQNDDCCFRSERAKPSVYNPVLPLYKALGKGESFKFHNNLDPGTHNYDLDNRQQFYRFLNRNGFAVGEAMDDDIPSKDEVRTPEELTVGLPDGNENFISLGLRQSRDLPRHRVPDGNPDELSSWQTAGKRRLRKILRYSESRVSGEIIRELRRESFLTTGLRLKMDNGLIIPAVEITDEGAKSSGALIVAADKGRSEAAPYVLEALRSGMRVIVLDVLLSGEYVPRNKTSLEQFAIMFATVGERPLGIQASQLAAASVWAAKTFSEDRISLLGIGRMSGIAALVATALEEKISGAIAVEVPVSLKLLIENKVPYNDCPSLFCFGLLEEFDVRELIGLIIPRQVSLICPEGDPSRVNEELAPVRKLYKLVTGTDIEIAG